MKSVCSCESTNDLTLEGDIGADPIWCGQCGNNLDLAEVPLSAGLKTVLTEWIALYGSWIDWEKDQLEPSAVEKEIRFNTAGASLLKEVQKELGHRYTIRYIPAVTTSYYAEQ